MSPNTVLQTTSDRILEYLKKNKNATVREVMNEMKLATPSAAHYHIKKLILSGKIVKNTKWE